MESAASDRRRRSLAWVGPRGLIVGYFVVLVLVAAVGVPALLSTMRALNVQERRSNPTEAATGRMLTGALDEETGVRGYVITADLSFLRPFDTGEGEVASALAVLRGPDTDTGLRDDVGAMDLALRNWRATFADPVIAEVRSGRSSVARAQVLSGRGKELFDRFRTAQSTLADAVTRDVAASRQRLRHDIEFSLAGLLIALAVGFSIATGLWFWWRIRGRRDVERERALADLAVLLRAVLEATTDPIFAKDTDGRHILANHARAASLNRGDPDVDVLGRPIDDFVDEQMAADVRSEERDILATGRESRTEEILRQPDGPHIFVTTKNPLEASDGRRIGIVGVARDVTFERRLQADRERLYQVEHRLAETLQQSMLGNNELDDDRLDVVARYQPAVEELRVGGDWYDVVALPNDMVGLIVGDAVGRGIDAATAMGQLRSALTALALGGLEPGRAISAVEAFAHTIPGAHSATCVYVIIDPTRAEIVYSVAGHMPPLVVSLDGSTRFLDGYQDPPLAAARLDPPRRANRTSFPVGSTLVLFTDGLVERRREPLDVGFGRLASAAAASIVQGRSVRELCDNLFTDLLADQVQADDVAVVAARLLSTHSDHFQRRFDADAAHVRRIRHEFRVWIEPYDLGSDTEDDLTLALGEALANSVEHAYEGGPAGVVEVDCIRTDAGLNLTVRDHGTWQTPDPDAPDRPVRTDRPGGSDGRSGNRGRGLMLMRHLVDEVTVTTDGRGTVVSLEYHFRNRST